MPTESLPRLRAPFADSSCAPPTPRVRFAVLNSVEFSFIAYSRVATLYVFEYNPTDSVSTHICSSFTRILASQRTYNSLFASVPFLQFSSIADMRLHHNPSVQPSAAIFQEASIFDNLRFVAFNTFHY